MLNVPDSQQGKTGSGGDVTPDRFLAMSPTTVTRWARSGRSFKPLGPPPPSDDEVGGPLDVDGDTDPA
jgi:hypothetical protein